MKVEEIKLKSWFDCLNGVAIELGNTWKFDKDTLLINTMKSAGITIDEVRWAQEQEYSSIQDALIAYEGELMFIEEQQENA